MWDHHTHAQALLRYLFRLSSCGALSITHLLGGANTCKQPSLSPHFHPGSLFHHQTLLPPPAHWESCIANHPRISLQSHSGASKQLLLMAQLACSYRRPTWEFIGRNSKQMRGEEEGEKGEGGVVEIPVFFLFIASIYASLKTSLQWLCAHFN